MCVCAIKAERACRCTYRGRVYDWVGESGISASLLTIAAFCPWGAHSPASTDRLHVQSSQNVKLAVHSPPDMAIVTQGQVATTLRMWEPWLHGA